MARLVSPRELSRLARQRQHIQDYYIKLAARQGESVISATIPLGESHAIQDGRDHGQDGSGGLSSTIDGASDP